MKIKTCAVRMIPAARLSPKQEYIQNLIKNEAYGVISGANIHDARAMYKMNRGYGDKLHVQWDSLSHTITLMPKTKRKVKLVVRDMNKLRTKEAVCR